MKGKEKKIDHINLHVTLPCLVGRYGYVVPVFENYFLLLKIMEIRKQDKIVWFYVLRNTENIKNTFQRKKNKFYKTTKWWCFLSSQNIFLKKISKTGPLFWFLIFLLSKSTKNTNWDSKNIFQKTSKWLKTIFNNSYNKQEPTKSSTFNISTTHCFLGQKIVNRHFDCYLSKSNPMRTHGDELLHQVYSLWEEKTNTSL